MTDSTVLFEWIDVDGDRLRLVRYEPLGPKDVWWMMETLNSEGESAVFLEREQCAALASVLEQQARYDPEPEPETIHLPALLSRKFGISTSEAKRGIMLGAVRVEGEVWTELDAPAERLAGKRLTYGKRREMVVDA